MNTRNPLIASALLAVSLISGAAHAALQGRDLNGSIDSFEAYYDTDLDITWLADANHAKTSGYDDDGKMTWVNATIWAADLSFTDGVNVYANWRLPTVKPINGVSFSDYWSDDGSTDKGYNISEQGTAFAGSTSSEMAHLFYNTLNNIGYYTPLGTASGCSPNSANPCLDNVGPFSNLQPDVYWSATEYDPNTGAAWGFVMVYGYQHAFVAEGANGMYALAVSPGDVGIAAIPEPETYAMMLAGLGLVGWRARRRG